MSNPLISVIVPVYNVEKYLDRCVESIVNQTYKNLEIILVDDGSPDNCPAMCDAWAEKDSRIKVIHKENGGVSAARNDAIATSNGEYITFVDSDDWIDVDMIDYLYTLILDNSAQISCIEFCEVSENQNGVEKVYIEETVKVYDFENVIKDSIGYMCGKLYDKKLFSLLPSLPDDITVLEDTLLNFFLFKNCDKLIHSNLQKYYYFRHPGSALWFLSYKMIDDSIRSQNIILSACEKGSSVYKYQVRNRVGWDFFLINSIVSNQACLDRYDLIKDDIRKYRKIILEKNIFRLFNKKIRLGILLFLTFPRLYNSMILLRKRIRGY